MSEENIPEVNNTPDVAEEPKSAFKELVESVSDLAAKAGEIVEDAVKSVAEEVKDGAVNAYQSVKETVLGAEEKVEEAAEAVEVAEEEAESEPAGEPADLGGLTLAELSDMFDKLSQDENRMRRYKEAEAIKSAFYKRLSKEKDRLEGELKRVAGKLANEAFVSKAPEKVINAEKEKQSKYQEMYDNITDRIKMLSV